MELQRWHGTARVVCRHLSFVDPASLRSRAMIKRVTRLALFYFWENTGKQSHQRLFLNDPDTTQADRKRPGTWAGRVRRRMRTERTGAAIAHAKPVALVHERLGTSPWGPSVCLLGRGFIYVFIYLFIYLFICWRPSQQHMVTSGLFTESNLTEVEYNTKHAHFTHVKQINIIRKLVPSVLQWQIKLGDASTIDHFGLEFQYQIKKQKWTKSIAH